MYSFLNRILQTKYEKRITALVTLIVLIVGVSLTATLSTSEQDIRQRASELPAVELNPSTDAREILQPTITEKSHATLPTIDPLSTILSISTSLNSYVNLTPVTRIFTLTAYTSENIAVTTESSPLLFQNGVFRGTFNIGNLQSGSYIIKIRTPGFLEKPLNTTPLQITKGDSLTLPQSTLTPGDIDGDGQINSLDYSILKECYEGLSTTTPSCDITRKEASDLNGDSKVDQIDYNILLRNIK